MSRRVQFYRLSFIRCQTCRDCATLVASLLDHCDNVSNSFVVDKAMSSALTSNEKDLT